MNNSEPNTISIVSKKYSLEKLRSRNLGAAIIDVTSKSDTPWIRFSPFYPHNGIPIPFSPGAYGASVEGIWQGLKVFENADIDMSKFSITTMKGIKRSSKRFGKILGHRAGVAGDYLLSYLDARKQIYLPCYHWVLENVLFDEIKELRRQSFKQPIILLDFETNEDILNLKKPLSHASLIKKHLELLSG